MLTSDFDYDLPQEKIAQAPAEPRDLAKMLVVRSATDLEDSVVRSLPAFLAPGDLLVLNDTRVIPARVHGVRESGGRVELLFLEPVVGAGAEERPGSELDAWRAMVKPAKKMRGGMRVQCAQGIVAEFLSREESSGYWRARLLGPDGSGPSEGATAELMGVVGALPLPPYIDHAPTDFDEERYQTVYARRGGAVAAPTAGLHFTDELLHRIEDAGVELTRVTLHVGAGTFLPVMADSIEDHPMHSERFELGEDAAQAVEACRLRGGRVIAVGTTSARVLESCAQEDVRFERCAVAARKGETDIFLHPGSRPRVCDGLLTNFHLPKSTLLMLVASFIGMDGMRSMYARAVGADYRFYSYGDASLLLP